MKKQSKKLQLINKLIKKHKYKSYLEIGVRKCKTFNQVKLKKSQKVGVDPAYKCKYQMTSDKFFKINEDTFDIILIEGNRQGDIPYRDIVNSLNILNEGGTIVIRGANQPKDWFYNKKLKIPRWKETVWKAVSQIHIETDCLINTIKDENGLSIIKNGGGEHYSIYEDLDKEYFLAHRKELLKLISWKASCREISRPDGTL